MFFFFLGGGGVSANNQFHHFRSYATEYLRVYICYQMHYGNHMLLNLAVGGTSEDK